MDTNVEGTVSYQYCGRNSLRVSYNDSGLALVNNFFSQDNISRLKGRVAIVTGASSGIGAAICRSLVQLGMVVVGAARRVDKIKVFLSKY